jgi:hypothetical protein
MKRSFCLVAISLPLTLSIVTGAAMPPVPPVPGYGHAHYRPAILPAVLAPEKAGDSAEIVKVDFFDRLFRDGRTRNNRSSAYRRATRTKNANPAAPPLAAIPIPIPKPAGDVNATTAAPAPIPVPSQVPAQAAPSVEATAPEAPAAGPVKPGTERATDTTSQAGNGTSAAPQPGASPAPPPPPAAPERREQPGTRQHQADTPEPQTAPSAAPLVQQPATATEPAHATEVPTPLAKPTDGGTPANKVTQDQPSTEKPEPDTAPQDKAPQNKAEQGKAEHDKAEQEKSGQDQKRQSAPDTEKAAEDKKPDASPPPPPLMAEDPDELKACLADLQSMGTKFTAVDRIDDGDGCGIEKPFDIAEVLPGIKTGNATMRCKTAQSLAHWLKDTVKPAMNIAMPGRHIVGITPGSTYACRLRNNASTGKISEHAHGNAFDVAAFTFDNGEKMELTPRQEDSTMEGAFQRTITAGACLHFTTVLSPGSDAAHETHLHLDVIERKGGYRYCR